MPVIVPVVLIVLPRLVRFRRIVALRRIRCRIRRHNRRPLIQIERNLALQMNRIAKIISRRKVNGPATGNRRRRQSPD